MSRFYGSVYVWIPAAAAELFRKRGEQLHALSCSFWR